MADLEKATVVERISFNACRELGQVQMLEWLHWHR